MIDTSREDISFLSKSIVTALEVRMSLRTSVLIPPAKHSDQYYYGSLGFTKNIPRAIQLWTQAAELGSLDAHSNLGDSYYNGDGVEEDVPKGHPPLAAGRNERGSREQAQSWCC